MSKINRDFSTMEHITQNDLKVIHTKKNGSLGISVVNTPGHGKRVKLTSSLFEALGSPKAIQFVADGDYLILGATIPYATESVPFSSGVGSNIIYTASFVNYVTSRFFLDFNSRTSISFRDVELETQMFEGDEIIFAVIKMAQE